VVHEVRRPVVVRDVRPVKHVPPPRSQPSRSSPPRSQPSRSSPPRSQPKREPDREVSVPQATAVKRR
jgi:hypothetical protein